MLCSVGAFAIWRRDVVLELGGFSRTFTCEDIEFTFRVHNRFLRQRRPRRILALPNLVGTTEGPDTIRRLVIQRARWQRVIMETVWHYRHMFLNPRYGSVGLIGMPFYVLSEVLAPFMQTLSVGVLVLAPALGLLDWSQFVLSVGAIAFSAGTFTNAAILLQDSMFRTYSRADLRRLVLLGPLDLVLYRPIIFYAQLKGAVEFLRGDKGWHKFERNRRE
jgi:cellulose synthase/poly-beta-1,6-N-acetylglucosamine synthase-like glycosyltransferase